MIIILLSRLSSSKWWHSHTENSGKTPSLHIKTKDDVHIQRQCMRLELNCILLLLPTASAKASAANCYYEFFWVCRNMQVAAVDTLRYRSES